MAIFSTAAPPTSTGVGNAAATYSPSAQSVALNATVTGTGTVNGGSVTFTVKQGATVIGSPIAGNVDIIFGSALSTSQLNATAGIPGTFVYTPPAGTVLQAGLNQSLSTQFTPADSVNYSTTSTSVLINVKPPTTSGLVLTRLITRDPSTNELVVRVSLANTSATAYTNVALTGVWVNTNIPAAHLPLTIGTIASSGVGVGTVRVPGNAVTAGQLALINMWSATPAEASPMPLASPRPRNFLGIVSRFACRLRSVVCPAAK